MRGIAERHIATWPRRRSFPVLPSMQAITLEIIVTAVFGVEDATQRARFGAPLRALLDMLGSRRQVLMLALSLNRSGRRSPWARFAAAREEADALLYAEIRRRRESGDEEGEDIFSLLLAARDEDGEPLTDSELRDELMTLLVAGHETTATALAWALERLRRSPRVLARLLEADDDAYLDAVIKETLRLRPVVPAVVRRLAEPMQFGPWNLPAGVNIAPSIYLLHRREDIYADAEAFRPERFLGADTPGTYEWIPFGGGVRRCLGASFALFEMKVVLGEVLRAVRLRETPRMPPEGVTRRAITFAPSRGGRIAVC